MIEELLELTRRFAGEVSKLSFSEPVSYIYNPLQYAADPHEEYLRRYGAAPKRVVFWGMNPGPFGMAQTGIPFGEVDAVRNWLKIEKPVARPARQHPKRPVDGFSCSRSEVSGRRLWALFAERFGTPEQFFTEHFVANYCPLSFMSESGANITPNKLTACDREPLFRLCDAYAAGVIRLLQPDRVVGIGRFAEKRLHKVIAAGKKADTGKDEAFFENLRVSRVLHPSPASPMANQGWAEQAKQDLLSDGIWFDS